MTDEREELEPGIVRVWTEPDVLQATLPCDAGLIVLQWPAAMSADDLEDFAAWLGIVARKMERAVRAREGAGGEPPE